MGPYEDKDYATTGKYRTALGQEKRVLEGNGGKLHVFVWVDGNGKAM